MLNHQRVTFPLGCLFLPWSQELQFVEDVVLVYGGWADPGAEPAQGSMASLESFKLRQVRIPEMGQDQGQGQQWCWPRNLWPYKKGLFTSIFLSEVQMKNHV